VAAGHALGDGDTLACELGGGNGITLALRVTGPSDPSWALTGRWDDASLSPHLPVHGALLEDPNFGLVGGLTYVGFTGRPLPRAPFGVLPRGVHVQFRLAPPEERGSGYDLVGRWADDRGAHGPIGCALTPAPAAAP
jgi:hypothetical protein